MNAIRITLTFIPVPLYDVNAELVKPSMYEDILAGALVEIQFTFSHWLIHNPAKDQYACDVQRIKVISPPQIVASNFKNTNKISNDPTSLAKTLGLLAQIKNYTPDLINKYALLQVLMMTRFLPSFFAIPA